MFKKASCVLAAFLVYLCAPVTLAADNARTAQTPPSKRTAPSAEPPAELNTYGLGWKAKGSGTLRFLGFKAYDITLWLPAAAADNFSFNRSFALDITYNANVRAEDISNTSLIEMSRISSATSEQVNAWSSILKNLFVDVKNGDRLIGVHLPTAGARFFLNGKLLGETTDTSFSEAFFKIWLDPKALKPELRAALLGM